VVIARAQRQRRAYTPQEIRERLHARLAEAAEAGPGSVRTPHRGDGRKWFMTPL
jgi:hypothetical protein